MAPRPLEGGKGTLPYFAYGSDMRSGEIDELLGRPIGARRALLQGFRLAFTANSREWRGGVADITRDEEGQVEGVLFDLTGADALRMGVEEGFSEGLRRRRKVTVETEDGEQVEAVTLEVASKRGKVAPAPEYLDAMVEGASERGLKEGYVTYLLSLYPDDAPARWQGEGENE